MDEIVGGSLTGSTPKLNVLVAVAAGRGVPKSVKTKVIVTDPVCPVAGTMVTEQFGAVPEIVIIPLGTIVVFEEVPTTFEHVTVESITAIVKLTLFEVDSFVDWAEIAERVGTSFAGATVKANVVMTLFAGRGSPASVNVRVILAIPDAFKLGVASIVQLGADPPIIKLPLATKEVFEDVATTLEQFTVESTSAIVKAIEEMIVSSAVN